MNNRTSIVVGASGFVGYHLTKVLSDAGYNVYAVVRLGSASNKRIYGMPNVQLIEADAENPDELARILPKKCDLFFNLAWKPADRYDYFGQMDSAYLTLQMLELASAVECGRFVGIGSQAEYGICPDVITENDTPVQPFCGYGAAKVAACYLTRERAKDMGIEWVWGRIFSIYGQYEPSVRLLPHIISCFEKGEDVSLSSCRQNWDFLFAPDAGEALLAMAEKGVDGEIYNIADGRYRPLKDYVEEMIAFFGGNVKAYYGNDPSPFVSLQPSMDKLKRDTGWYPKTDFLDGVKELTRGTGKS